MMMDEIDIKKVTDSTLKAAKIHEEIAKLFPNSKDEVLKNLSAATLHLTFFIQEFYDSVNKENTFDKELFEKFIKECGCYERDNKKDSSYEWISVKDRLPQKNIQVLCFNGGQLFGSCTLAEIKNNKDGSTYWYIYGNHEDNSGVGRVTHWMPLPEYPR